jgi:cytochrome c oxidase subunit II
VTIAVIVGVLLWATFTAEAKVDKVSATPGLRVDVTAFKWQWRFDYPGQDVRPSIGTDSHHAQLVVPEDTVVGFRMTSRDVIHALWIPAARFKRDAFPNRYTSFDLVFDTPGTFPGRCAEFCGLEHAGMTLEVRVLTKPEFDGWLAAQRR